MALRVMQTARFELRPLMSSDANLYIALYTNAQVMRHVGEPLTLAAARRSFEKVVASNQCESGEYRTWVVVDRSTRDAWGLLALVAREGASEIGALIWPRCQNAGVATEIICRLMDHAFEDGVETVFTRHRAVNGGAEGLMRKLDFERTPAVGSWDGVVRWERTRQRWQRAASIETTAAMSASSRIEPK
jgi:RimJ/RimL family protein N-acetyltransferase